MKRGPSSVRFCQLVVIHGRPLSNSDGLLSLTLPFLVQHLFSIAIHDTGLHNHLCSSLVTSDLQPLSGKHFNNWLRTLWQWAIGTLGRAQLFPSHDSESEAQCVLSLSQMNLLLS